MADVAAGAPLSKVELRLAAHDLPRMDLTSESDPQVYVYLQDRKTNQWTPLGCTEVIWNTANPKFVKSFVLDYYFEEVQLLRFCIVDVDKDTGNFVDHKLIGTLEITLAEIANSQSIRPRDIVSAIGKRAGHITFIVEEVIPSEDLVSMSFGALNIAKKGFLHRHAISSFLVISRSREDGVWVPVYKTEQSIEVNNPAWKPFTVGLSTLCNGDRDRALKFEIFEYIESGNHVLLGETSMTVNEIAKSNLAPVTLKNVGKLPETPILRVLDFKQQKNPTFLEYVFGGAEISLIVAIDCTGSNGDPSSPESLHYRAPGVVNEYQHAIQSIGALAYYDSDKKFPVFGFGAKLRTGQVSHCFAMNNNPTNPEVDGIQGILDTYHTSLSQISLHGPTNFSPIINEAAEIARRTMSTGRTTYFILLMITDGEISDMESTQRAIIKACNLPLSIVIVGVGSADFANMEKLDGDDSPLSKDPNFRDIVQFVPMRDFRDASGKQRLPQALLSEIPSQFVSYMKQHNIMPNLPQYRS